MRAQRVRDAENRIEMQIAKWTAEGTVKSSVAAEYSVTWGIRQLPEICWYLAKSRGHTLKQGGTAEVYPSLTSICQGRIFL